MVCSVKKTFLTVCIGFIVSPAFAVNIQQPRFSESFNYITLPDGGSPVDRFGFPSLILSYDFAKNPLVTKNIGNDSRTEVLVKSFSSISLGFHQKLSSRWALTIDTAFNTVELPTSKKSSKWSDLNLRLRYRFKETSSSKYSIHFIGQAPTGDESLHLSDKSFGYGLKFQYEKDLSKSLKTTFLVGYLYSKDAEFLDLDYVNRMQTSLGLNYKVTNKLNLNSEWSRDWTLPFNSNLNPNEFLLSLSYHPYKKLMLFLGAGTGNFNKEDSSDYRMFAGFKYRPGFRGLAAAVSKDAQLMQLNEDTIETPQDVEVSQQVHSSGFNHGDMTYKSSNVFFKIGGTNLRAEEVKKLKQVANFLNSKKNFYIYIVGHADAVGEEGDNFRLSSFRSEAVYKFFRSQGVSHEKMNKIAQGEKEPFDSVYRDGVSSPYNRRVQVLMFYSGDEK